MRLALILLGAAAVSHFALPSPRSTARVNGPGQTLYEENGCDTCHGPAGEGTAAGPSVAMGALALADFVQSVREPPGTMSAYGADVLSDADLVEIYAFLEPRGGESLPRGDAEAGAELYRRTGCYECHSNEAQGGAQGPRLGPGPVSFARFTWYVRHPSGSMPPYSENVVSDRELADIYAFVEARPEPPPLGDIPLLAPRR